MQLTRNITNFMQSIFDTIRNLAHNALSFTQAGLLGMVMLEMLALNSRELTFGFNVLSSLVN